MTKQALQAALDAQGQARSPYTMTQHTPLRERELVRIGGGWVAQPWMPHGMVR